MSSKLILRTTTGEIYETPFKSNKKVAELIQFVQDKYKLSPKTRLIFQGICLNHFPNKEVHDLGIGNTSEIIVTNHKPRTVFDELKDQESKQATQHRPESVALFGKVTKFDPKEFNVNPHMIAHVTNAKTPLKRKKDRASRLLDLITMLESNGGSRALFTMLGHPPTVSAEPAKVQQLVDMGFDRANAERALGRFGNNVSRATEYLLTQNENPAEVVEEEAKAESGEEQERPPIHIVGIQNLFAELLRGGPRHEPEDEPPEAESSE